MLILWSAIAIVAILIIFYREQLGLICLLLLMGGWWCLSHLGEVIALPFRLLWWILCLPFRLVYWLICGLRPLSEAVERQWCRDKSIFFAKFLIFLLGITLVIKLFVK